MEGEVKTDLKAVFDQNRGWVKMWRDIENWEWVDDPFMFWFFFRVVLMANHEEKKWHGMTIHRGEFITSYANLAVSLRTTTKRVRTALEKLNRSGELAIKTSNKFTIISITNYDSYQSVGTQTGNQRANKGQTAGKQRATTKELKELKELKNIKAEINSPLSVLFDAGDSIQTWLCGGLESVQERLLKDYDETYLRAVLVHCFEWQRENKKRSAGTFIEAWIKRDKNAKFKGGLTEHQKKLKDFFESQGCVPQEI